MKIIAMEPIVYNLIVPFEIEGKKVLRRIYWNRYDGLYILYKGKRYYESEFSYAYSNSKGE